MDIDQKDALRERNRRRANCPRCGGQPRELSPEEIARRADTLPGIRYRECTACGNCWAVRGGKR